MSSTGADIRVDAARLRRAVAAVFESLGMQASESARVADHLVEANLRGHDSHGVGMLPVYVANALSGEMKISVSLATVIDDGPILVFDAGLGIGQIAAHDAIGHAIERARAHGACVLGLRNSHHIGRIGAWAEQCAAAGMVSAHFVNVVSTPSVAPFGGLAPRVGTNPMAVGLPRAGRPPVVVDFATSRLAVGKVRVAHNKREPLPEGVLLDATGEPTQNPGALFGSPPGAILPFGEHKGWALAFACEILAAALTGGETQAGPKRRDAVVNCMLSLVVSPERIGTAGSYFRELEAFVDWVRSPPRGRAPSVLLPGEPELARRAERLAEGVPIDPTTWKQIVACAESASLGAEAFAELSGVTRP